MKKPSSRSQRGGSKSGIKGKHILQICVLLGVCIWLIYQVKYSHEKKKEFYEKDGKKSVLLSESKDELVKLGRKDLLPKHVEEDEDEEDINSHGGEEKETKSKVDHEEEKEEEEEEEVVEEDEEDKNKQGEEVVEEDEEENKHEEDEIDEQDQSKTVGDTDKDDEFLEEEEKEKETNNHADEIDEGREEHYRDDDASSAVSHESRILNSEKLKESSENNANVTNGEVEMQKEPFLKLGEAERGDFMNKTTTLQLKDGDSESSSSETKDTVTESGNSTVAILEASGFLQKETQIMKDRSQEDDAPPGELSDLKTRNESSPNNITVSANITNKDFIKDESRNKSSLLQSNSGSNTTEVNESSRSEDDDESLNNLFSTEQKEEADDTSENSISQEEMEALTDTQTLPDIRTEGNEEDEEEAIAAE